MLIFACRSCLTVDNASSMGWSFVPTRRIFDGQLLQEREGVCVCVRVCMCGILECHRVRF